MINFKDFILDDLDRLCFNCYVQQIISIVYHFHGEYWKLFDNDLISIDDSIPGSLDDKIIYRTKFYENLKDIYNIELKEIDIEDFINNKFDSQVYLVNFNMAKYPLCSNVENKNDDEIHSFIIYDFKNEKYIIHDNFYRKTNYEMTKSLLKSGCKKIYLVTKSNCVTVPDKIIIDNFTNFIKENQFSGFILKLEDRYKKGLRFDLDTFGFFNKLRDISSIKKRQSIFIQNVSDLYHDPFLNECSLIENFICSKWQDFWYSLMKYEVKTGKITDSIFVEKYSLIKKYIKLESLLYKEILNILLSKPNLKTELINDFRDFTKIEDFEDKVIKDYYDGLTILNLINFFEEKFKIQLDSNIFTKFTLFNELLLYIYKTILLNYILKGGDYHGKKEY